MSDTKDPFSDPTQAFSKLFDLQDEAAQSIFGQMMPGVAPKMPDLSEAGAWAKNAATMQSMWLSFQAEQAAKISKEMPDPTRWMAYLDSFHKRMPMVDMAAQQQFWGDSMSMWKGVLGQFGGQFGDNSDAAPELPRKDKRFRDERWQNNPVFALIHQTYLLMAEQLESMVDRLDGVEPDKKEQLRFSVKAVVDALSPSNFAATNPVVLERTLETKGENLVKGMQHMLDDMRRGQLTHTDPDAFTLGENIAVTPGKVVHETPMYQLIQYSPSTEEVLEVPLVIFPPWINRFLHSRPRSGKELHPMGGRAGPDGLRGQLEIGRRLHERRSVGRLHPQSARNDRSHPRAAEGAAGPRDRLLRGRNYPCGYAGDPRSARGAGQGEERDLLHRAGRFREGW